MAKTKFYSLAALVRKILFCHSKIKFISWRHRVISSIYLDGVSFYHKYNPLDGARAPKGKIWEKKGKGTHAGSGSRVVKMIVAISYGKSVIYCEQYEKLYGNYYAGFIRRKFQNMFQKSGKCSKLFLQDNCLTLNCAKARKALKEVGGELFPISKRSSLPDRRPKGGREREKTSQWSSLSTAWWQARKEVDILILSRIFLMWRKKSSKHKR